MEKAPGFSPTEMYSEYNLIPWNHINHTLKIRLFKVTCMFNHDFVGSLGDGDIFDGSKALAPASSASRPLWRRLKDQNP